MRHAAALLIAATLLGCRREQDPPAQSPQPYGAYGQQRPYGTPGQPYGTYGQPPPGQPAPQQPGHPVAVMVGTAWGLLGMLAQAAAPQRPAGPPQPTGSPQPQPTAAPPTWGLPAGGAAPGGWEKFESDVLALTNQRRAAGATCGGRAYPPAPPLVGNQMLHTSARGHAVDMGTRGYFDHTTPEGRSPSDRARAAGYPKGVGENIAAGQRTPDEVVSDWMTSPGHCSNIMDGSYTQLGVGYARVNGSMQDYWVQVFGG